MSQGPANYHQLNMTDEINPYAPTATAGLVAHEPSDVKELRKAHLSHEASIKAIGTLISVYILNLLLSQKGRLSFRITTSR